MTDESKIKTTWRERAQDTKRLVQEPSYAKEYFPKVFVRAWRSRGGSWYGIGYLGTFLYLEITMTLREISEAQNFRKI